MLEGQPAPQTAHNYDWMTIAQLVISGLGMAFSLLIAGLLAILGLVGVFSDTAQRANSTNLIGLAWISLLVESFLLHLYY